MPKLLSDAVWRGAQTTVRFNFAGGSAGTTSCDVGYGKFLPSDKLIAPERFGFLFAGYYTMPDKCGDLVYNADMSLSEYYKANPWSSVETVVDLYAAWDPINYTIAFVNGTENLSEKASAVYGSSLVLPTAEELGVSVPEGYSFKGWSVIPGSDSVYYTDGQTITSGLTGENGATVYLYAVILQNVVYKVTLPASVDGCTVTYNDTVLDMQKDIIVNQNEDVSFSLKVEDGYSADKITVLANGIMLGAMQTSENTYVYNLKSVSADTDVKIYNVNKETFSIILNDGTGYSVSPKKSVIENGEPFEFSVTLAEGYKTATPIVYINGSSAVGTKAEDVFTYRIPTVTEQPVISVSVIEKLQYTVTFLSNGSIYSVSTIEEDQRASEPSVPERNGYTFGGWYTNKECTTSYDFMTAITSPVTLYAKWTANTYTVQYDKNTTDVVLTPAAQTKKHDTVLSLSSDIPSRTGYTFAGWNTKSDGTGTNYSAGGELSINSNITLYAQWKINKYAVNLTVGDGVNGTISANEVAYNEIVKVTAAIADDYRTPTITAVPQENAELVSEGVYKITGPVSFVITAEPKEIYTASFYVEGGLYYTQSALEGSNDKIVLPNPPAKQGHAFAGWYTEKTGGTEVNAVTALDRNMSVYARFEVNMLIITPAADGVGYAVASADSTDVNYDGRYTFTITIAEHYNTDNMRVYANGVLLAGSVSDSTYTYTVENITANQIITVTGVELDKHTVTYMVDGQVYATKQTDYGALLAEPASPVRAGKTFKGWSDGSYTWNFSADKVAEDMTLYAVWEGDTFTVTPAQSGTGFEVTSNDSTYVNYGGSYAFTITIAEHYNANSMRVYANGILLIPDVNGNEYEFIVKNIANNITITVSDVKADNYTVKYVVDGETYYRENVVYTGKAQRPKAPVKAGHTFDGWFFGEDEWDFAAEVEYDLELEAKFIPLTYLITVPENQSGFTVNVTSENPVEYGGSFAFDIVLSEGYNTSDMEVYANGILIEKSSENENTVFFEINDVTEAIAIAVRGIGQSTYAVTYRSNTIEYVGNMPENAIKTYSDDIMISDLIPERYGYYFIGWSTAENGMVEYDAGDVYSENNDLVLYAVWEAKTFAVSFETNGGSINSGEITEYVYGTETLLPADVTKEGYNFAGWYEDELLQGVRVYEINDSDYGDKKYYAAYSMADVTVNDYAGEYDGKAHDISYTLTDNLTVENYQWYFVPDGEEQAIAVSSDSYSIYKVKDVAQSGKYYCYIEALADNYVIRFFTESGTVTITKKPISVKAADSSKVYDSQPLATNEIELINESSLGDSYTISAVMTAESTITNVGTKANEIDKITILDSENNNATDNYEITKQSGMLTVTPLALTVTAENISAPKGSSLSENRLYKINGIIGNDKLSLANASVTAKNANGEDVSFEDITKNAGKYTVTIVYNGFDGEGSENYQGNGTITSTVNVYRRGNGIGGGSGGSASGSNYTVQFDTNGGSSVTSQSVKAGTEATEPNVPEKEGYTFDGWYSDSNFTEEFNFAAKITKNTTLYAKWTEAKPDEEQKPEDTLFADPTKTGVADLLETESHIQYLNGYDDDTFMPENSMTRAEAVQVFYNLLLNKNVSGETAFVDVSADAWYYDAVITLANMGIIKGKEDNSFDPDGEITRAEFAAISMRFVNIGVNGTYTFTDVPQNYWAAKDISDAAELGWISGNGDGTFSPDTSITRASATKIVNNMLGRKADMEYANAHADSIKLFRDVSASAWYYADVVEATNAHEYEKTNGIESWK